MPTVNFYLKKAEAYPRQSIMKKADAKSAKSLIYLQFKYKGQKFVYSFGEKIHRDNWNPEKQRVKSNNQTTSDGEHSLNDLLKNLAELCEKSYREELKDGIPSKRKLKEHLDNFFYRNLQEDNTERPTLFKLITRFEAGEIKTRGKDKSQGTLNNYKSVRLHLTEFQKKHGYKVDFETINLDFFYQYVSFLKNGLKKKNKKGFTGEVAHLKPNTIAKDIRLLKVFMAEAVDMGFTNNLQFKHKKFTVEGEETDAVYLTEKEVIRLYHCDFSDHNKLEQVRDLFVVGCFTGLRYSDYSNIKPENIITRDDEIFIKMHTQKTGELVIIPCNPVVLNVFNKYKGNENRLPRSISNQKFNDYVKDACKAAELIEKGRLSTNPNLELWQCVSSHTARRSFATNLYLEGFPTIDLMKITGHKTEKAFLKYIRVTKLDTAKRLSQHIKKNWSEKMLKVAS